MYPAKRIHRTLTLLAAALLLALTLMAPAQAWFYSYDAFSITVNQPGGNATLDGKVYSIWKIFDITDLTGPAAPVYAPDPDFEAFFTSYPAYTPAALSQSQTLLREMAADLKTWITANSAAADESKTGNAVDPIVFDGLPPGYYLVSGANGEVVTVVHLPDNVVITPKGGIPTLDMQVYETYLNSGNYYGEIADAQIGNGVSFKVTIENYPTLEQMQDFGNYYMTSYITLSTGLTYQENAHVTLGGEAFPDATISTSNTNGATVKVTIPLCLDGQYPTTWHENLKNCVSSQYPIEIHYSARLNPDAVFYDIANPETSVNTSTAVVAYNNDPADSSSLGQTVAKTAKVVTYAFGATKADSANHSTTLAGAVFELRLSLSSSYTALRLIHKGGNIYALADSASSATVSSIVTDESGKFYIQGLDSDWPYYLVETQAPAGYDLPENPVTEVKFNATAGSGNIALESLVLNVNGVPVNNYSFLIENSTSALLPGTGGIGTMLFTVGGAALVATAAVLFAVMRKRRKTNA